MMKRLVLLSVLLAGCTRDLALPEQHRLVITAPKTTVAPRETLQLAASGGAGGIRWELREEDRRSGPDATVDPATGAYQAGRRGSAQDVVRAIDSSGTVATLGIVVGPPLSVTPPVAVVAPGGTVAFTVTGGLGTPTFTVTLAPGSDSTVNAAGVYVAGAVGSIDERVVIGDETGDPAAVAYAEIHVGAALQVYPANVAVAPREAVDFVALGGEAPYTFALEPTPGRVDVEAVTTVNDLGHYVAGSNDADVVATDRVRVTDANGQVVWATVTVGRPLRLLPITSEAHSGIPVTLTATGGKEPYTFRFARNGNRTRGTIEPALGTYVPGPYVAATDLLEVRDSTGTVTAPLAVHVRSLRTFAALGEIGDSIALRRPSRGGAVLAGANTDYTYGGLPGGPPRAVVIDVPYGELLRTTNVLIPDGTSPRFFAFPEGPLDHLVLASYYGVQSMLQTFDGSFVKGPSAAQSDFGWTFAETRPGEIAALAMRGCTGVVRFSATSAAITPSACQAFPALGGAYAMGTTAADLDGACGNDLVFVTNAVYPDVVAVEYGGCDNASFPTVETLPLPSGAGRSYALGYDVIGRRVRLPDRDAVAMLLNGPPVGGGAIRNQLYLLRRDAGALGWLPPVDLLQDDQLMGLAAVPSGGSDLVLGWGSGPGMLRAVRPASDGGGAPFDLLDAPLPYPVTAVLPIPSRHGPDLLVRSTTGPVDVFLADGDGGFGRHQHAGEVLSVAQIGPGVFDGDFDGNGIQDAAVLRPDSSVSILFGGDHQVAAGPSTPLPYRPDWLVTGDFTGDGHASILFGQRFTDVQLGRGLGDGRFQAFVPFTFDNQHPGCRAVTDGGLVFPVDLGGDAPGPDLYIWEYPGVPTFLVRTLAGAVHVGASLPQRPAGLDPSSGWNCGNPWPLQPAPGGSGPGLVTTCVTETVDMSNPDPRASTTYTFSVHFAPLVWQAGLPVLGTWQQLTPESAPTTSFLVQGGIPSWGPRTVLLLSADELGSRRLIPVLVDGSGPTPVVHVTDTGWHYSALAARYAPVDGDDLPDLIVADMSAVYVAKGTTTGFGPVTKVASLQDVPGYVGPNLTPVRLSAGPGVDLLDIRADRTAGDLIIISNDGQGAFP
jgi:hypothetical protein